MHILIFLAAAGIAGFLLIFSTLSPKLTSYAQQACIPTDSPNYAIHSFIFANYQSDIKDYLFDKAAATGKKTIRFDFALATIEPNNDNADPNTSGTWNWALMDDMVTRAKAKGLTVVGTLGYSASWIAAPPASPIPPGFTYDPDKAPIDRSMITNGEYAEYVRETVNHYKGALEVSYWEIWNEPNIRRLYADDVYPTATLYVGSPYTYSDFADVLSVSYDTIKAADSADQVVFPGVIFDTGAQKLWAQNLANHPSAQNKYDIGNVHIRGSISDIQNSISQAVGGFPGKDVWVTEHDYTADWEWQQDPFKGTDIASGEQKQAEYYEQSLPVLIAGGADKIFVGLRDYTPNEDPCQPGSTTVHKSPFCWAGLVTLNTLDPPANYDRPSMCVFQNAGSIQAAKRVFVTNATYNGKLGGVSQMNPKCQTAANNAGLGGTWKTWLSSSTFSPANQSDGDSWTQHSGPYLRIDGVKVADNWTDLIDGSLDNPINVTEGGVPKSSGYVWTNTTTSGGIYSTSSHCSNWNSKSGQARRGDLSSTSSTWTVHSNQNCSSTARLYCFEQ